MAFKVIYQKDAMQCGIACLAMICRHYGRRLSLGYLEEFCTPTAEGVSMKGISDGAEALGMKATGCVVATDELKELPLPCVLHWEQNHFTVLYRVTKRKFHVADPAKGLVAYNRNDFESRWLSTESGGKAKGIALFLRPTERFHESAVNDKKGEKRSFSLLLRHMARYRKYLIEILAGLILATLLQLAIPFMTQEIVDTGIRFKDLDFIWLILIGQLMIIVGRTMTDFIRRRLLLHISMRVNISLLSDFFTKLLRLPMRFFDTKQSGDLLKRMSDHARVQSFLTDQMLGIMFTVISFIVFGAVLLCYTPAIFAVFGTGSLVYGLWTISFLRKRRVLDHEIYGAEAKSSNCTWQFITSMQEIKIQGCGSRRKAEWEETQADLFDVQMKSLRLRQTQETGSLFIRETTNIIITVIAAAGVIRGELTIGAMLAIQYVAGQLSSPVEQIMAFIYTIQDVKISLERINEIHERENEQAFSDSGLMPSPSAHAAENAIEFRNVSFRYDRHALTDTLRNIEIEIPRRKVTAIVGASGSGKTTLVKLMLGFYKTESGTLLADGQPLERKDIEKWRKKCGAVMQDGVIFSESIARNIATEDGPVDTGRLELAARTACIHDFIMGLPLKYNTKIGRDGTGISQGQKQRILIARAVYKNPDIIFLDEATNSLDAINEKEIVKNLAEFYKERTVVLVAHRLSTVKDADNIIVLENGEVAESGNHESLTAKKGLYYTLVKNQLELGS